MTPESCMKSRSKSVYSFRKGVSGKGQAHDTEGTQKNSRSRKGLHATN